jgi:hypothetical protein
MAKRTALDLCSHRRASLLAQSGARLDAPRRRIVLGAANCIVKRTDLPVRSRRIVMVRRVPYRHLAGHVGVSSACGIANRRRERRRDQQHCQQE